MTKIAQMFENEKIEAVKKVAAEKDAIIAEKENEMAQKDAQIAAIAAQKDAEIARLVSILRENGIAV